MTSSAGLHRRERESVVTRVRRHRSTPVALSYLFVIMALCASVTILRASLSSAGSGSIDHWNFDSDEDRIAIALDGFDVLKHGGNESPLVLTERGLTLGKATEVNSATYFQRGMPGVVNRIGVTAYFDPAPPGVTGQVALLIPASPLPTNPEEFYTGVPNMGVHFVFDNETWLMSVWRHDGGQDVLGVGRFPTQLVGERSVEIIRRDDEVTISLPDGLSPKFRDTRIGKWSGAWATWELYETGPGVTPATMKRIWAGWER